MPVGATKSTHTGLAVGGNYMATAPLISQQLLDYLDEVYPDKMPDVTVPIDEVRAMSGSVRVVRKLKQLFRDQQNSRAKTTQKE